MKYVWIGAAALFAVAAGAVWFAFGNPSFVWGLGSIALTSLVNAIAQAFINSKGSPEARRRVKEGLEPHDRESR